MNYRHAFHAGNFADVVKHIVLALALRHLAAKPKPIRVVDTHAGIGLYALDGDEAGRTGEWRHGIGRLIGADAEPLPADIAARLAPYLEAVAAVNAPGTLTRYPGSPALALHLLRPEDRLVACEAHPDDAATLEATLAGDARAKVLALDGWQGVRALLPPKERRGLVLIDPPFEEAGEFGRLAQGLADGLRRFATGTFVLWFPIKDTRAVIAFREVLAARGPAKLLWVELRTESLATAEGLAGMGLAIANPPFRLAEQMAALMPFLAARLATGAGGGWHLDERGASH